ncbi:hypothetical protein [Neobacillus niacini]|uniref:hypothetical protein n=1 Tax=Neobacillus niacini TaxID=86668 RepID=UPI0028671487|nr:hypothetical protein [Neobacillus niacini]MDR6998541.1 hypothetical protein [Neobacillus niacini]
MVYIIENANILKDNQLQRRCLLIKDNRIASIRTDVSQYKWMKMNAEAYIMTPTFVLLNNHLPSKGTFQEIKKYMTDTFLIKGCTTILTCVNVSYEKEILEKLREMKTALMGSPVDFIIGVKIPIKLLTQSLIRICKRERIPAIFVEINKVEELEMIPWGWIREAMFPFNNPLIPVISSKDKKEAKDILNRWNMIMIKEKIPCLSGELEENEPLSAAVLNKIGLYPQKASLMHGAEVSYNLYLKAREIKNVDEVSLFHYHGDRLVVTIHKGKVIRSGREVLYRPGNGEYVKVKTTSYFTI